MNVSTEPVTEVRAAIRAAASTSLIAPPKIQKTDPTVAVEWKPDGPEGIGEMSIEGRRRDRHRRSAEHDTGARFASRTRETEQHDVGCGRCSGEDLVALHLLLEPAEVLRSEVEFEKQLQSRIATFDPGPRPDLRRMRRIVVAPTQMPDSGVNDRLAHSMR
jgi:hypothetical protein